VLLNKFIREVFDLRFKEIFYNLRLNIFSKIFDVVTFNIAPVYQLFQEELFGEPRAEFFL